MSTGVTRSREFATDDGRGGDSEASRGVTAGDGRVYDDVRVEETDEVAEEGRDDVPAKESGDIPLEKTVDAPAARASASTDGRTPEG